MEIYCGQSHSLKMQGINSNRPIPSLTSTETRSAPTGPSKQRPPSSVAGMHGTSDYFRQHSRDMDMSMGTQQISTGTAYNPAIRHSATMSPYQDIASSAETVQYCESPMGSPETPIGTPGRPGAGPGSGDGELNTPPSREYRSTGFYIHDRDGIPVHLQVKYQEAVSELVGADLEDNHKGPIEQNSKSDYEHPLTPASLARRRQET